MGCRSGALVVTIGDALFGVLLIYVTDKSRLWKNFVYSSFKSAI